MIPGDNSRQAKPCHMLLAEREARWVPAWRMPPKQIDLNCICSVQADQAAYEDDHSNEGPGYLY